MFTPFSNVYLKWKISKKDSAQENPVFSETLLEMLHKHVLFSIILAIVRDIWLIYSIDFATCFDFCCVIPIPGLF